MDKSPPSKLELDPVASARIQAWYRKYLERWKQHSLEREQAMRAAAQRAEDVRDTPLF